MKMREYNLLKNRKLFFENNKKNIEINVMKIISKVKFPKSWKIYVVVSDFLNKKKVLPFEHDSWSATSLIAATKNQGCEIMIFLNKARIGFLSYNALIPIITHEIIHVNQAIKNSREYLFSIIDDNISIKLEKEAEKEIRKINYFRKREVIESILYCYDNLGWKGAKKMADFFYKIKDRYGGGYEEEMTKKEYELFLESIKKKSIKFFIEHFK